MKLDKLLYITVFASSFALFQLLLFATDAIKQAKAGNYLVVVVFSPFFVATLLTFITFMLRQSRRNTSDSV